MSSCRSEVGVPSAHRSDLRVPAGFNLNANDEPECDRPLFKKSALPYPGDKFAVRAGLMRPLPYCTRQCTVQPSREVEGGRQKELKTEKKERKRWGGRQRKIQRG